MKAIRRSVPTEGVNDWWSAGWMYVMPDFNTKDHSIIEWRSEGAPVEPNRVPEASQTESASHDRAGRQPA